MLHKNSNGSGGGFGRCRPRGKRRYTKRRGKILCFAQGLLVCYDSLSNLGVGAPLFMHALDISKELCRPSVSSPRVHACTVGPSVRTLRRLRGTHPGGFDCSLFYSLACSLLVCSSSTVLRAQRTAWEGDDLRGFGTGVGGMPMFGS